MWGQDCQLHLVGTILGVLGYETRGWPSVCICACVLGLLPAAFTTGHTSIPDPQDRRAQQAEAPPPKLKFPHELLGQRL